MGSVAPIPLRLSATEQALIGHPLNRSTIALARKTASSEISPIDDIRSTARYRGAVAANLVEEFLTRLSATA
jgi:CO/xanthine dehydrogenase FAD-binding subunit